MKKLVIFIQILLFLPLFACNTKINIEDTSVEGIIKQKINVLIDEYYEKFENKNFIFNDIKEKLYVKTATGLKTAYQVSFGSVYFSDKQKIKFCLGNNSYIYTLAFYKSGSDLFVFAPLLALEGSLNKTLLFCVDKQYFSVKVFSGEYDSLKLGVVTTMDNETASEVKAEKNNADRDVITHILNDNTSKLNVELIKNGENLSDNTILFTRKSYQKYNDPTEYGIFVSNQSRLTIFHDNFSGTDSTYQDLAVGVMGGGFIGFDLVLELKQNA